MLDYKHIFRALSGIACSRHSDYRNERNLARKRKNNILGGKKLRVDQPGGGGALLHPLSLAPYSQYFFP